MKLSIVVPCYNEEKNIPLILERFKQAINRDDVCVVLVENGSTDNSASVMDELILKYPFARKVSVKENKGYGFGIMSGLKQCDSEYLGWTHADMQTDPSDVIKALEIIEAQFPLKNVYAKGDRKGRPFMDQVFTMGMSLFETLYLKTPLWDINAQPNIFHRDFFSLWADEAPDDFSLDLFVLYQARKKSIKTCRFDVVFPERIHGASSWNDGFKSKWKFIKRTIDFSRKLKKDL